MDYIIKRMQPKAQKPTPSKTSACQLDRFVRIKTNITFPLPQAIVWQIKFIVNGVTSKKAGGTASSELQQLSLNFGRDFDKYLIKELVEQIDLRDPNKAVKDKTESFKCLLLVQELTRCATKPEFLEYFFDISEGIFSGRPADFLNELGKRLKLTPKMQVMIALSLVESSFDVPKLQCCDLLKQKVIEYFNQGSKCELIEEYALHRLSYIFNTYPEFRPEAQTNPNMALSFERAKKFVFDHNAIKPSQNVALRVVLFDGDLIGHNPVAEDPSNQILRNGSGLEHLSQASKVLEPWELLLDLGHFSSYNFQTLSMALGDFKDVTEKTMASTLLQLAINHQGVDNAATRLVFNTFETNKTGDPASLKKESTEKISVMQWHVAHFQRAFRENYSNLNWQKVFEAFSDLEEDYQSLLNQDFQLDRKAYKALLQLFNKCRPQNLLIPISLLFEKPWRSPQLQLSFIKNTLELYLSGEDKTFSFSKAARKIPIMPEIQLGPEISSELVEVWTSPELVERLIALADIGLFEEVRTLFEQPLEQLPEYLLLTITKCQFGTGCHALLDELLTSLMTTFLSTHPNSLPVLKKLWDFNKDLLIRGVCELCNHKNKEMNMSKVLDLSPEIKDCLIKIVYCQNYDFAVNLGVLAGKREFLHYDVWLKERIKQVGKPFVHALIRYLNHNVLIPCREHMIRSGLSASQKTQLSIEEVNALEAFKEEVLEKAHLSKERMCITIENLQTPSNFMGVACGADAKTDVPEMKIDASCAQEIRELVGQYAILFPKQVEPTQNTEEIDQAANDYFQHIFTAEQHEVDARIVALIDTMKKFKKSSIVKEQEIYACMLHGLFDEYRFLHKYPQQYLEKIAKLFGAIIQNKLLDTVLQDIALKFVIEAFRRDGKRQMFGIIVIKECLECLPDFPKQFQEIYEIRDKIQTKDRELYDQLGALYASTMKNVDQDDTEKAPPATSSSINLSFSNESMSLSDGESGKSMFSQTDRQVDQSKTKVESQTQKQVKQTSSQTKKDVVKEDKSRPTVFVPAFTNQQVAKDAVKPPPKAQAPNPPKATGQMFVPQAKPFESNLKDVKPTPTTQFNIASAAFTKEQATSRAQAAELEEKLALQSQNDRVQINVNAKKFKPSENQGMQQNQLNQEPPVFRALPALAVVQHPIHQMRNEQHVDWQKQIDLRVQDAIANKQKLLLEDLVKDPYLELPAQEAQEQIKFICNNTGKQNSRQKLEELKDIVVSKKPKSTEPADIEANKHFENNLNWLIHYILTKRISGQNQTLQKIYIDLIRQLGVQDATARTIRQAVCIFQRCMLIDENEFNKAFNKQGGQMQGSMVKMYLATLGQFIGTLTLGHNRPILSQELDLKQLLLQGFFHPHRRMIITFVCRILKASQSSQIFRQSNPWVYGILQILREIFEIYTKPQNQPNSDDIRNEIESLAKALNVNDIVAEIEAANHLSAISSMQCTSTTQQVELMHLNKRQNLVPHRISLALPNEGESAVEAAEPTASVVTENYFQNIQIPTEDVQILVNAFNFSSQDVQTVLKDAVRNAISEILQPVVDRSVGIALITTRELVLKDFACDGNIQRFIEAATQIVQNLAGSLALVTCREPLRISLTENLRKVIRLACENAGSTTGLRKVTQRDAEENPIHTQQQNDEYEDYLNHHETLFEELALIVSRDNLELGCKIIKHEVMSRALEKVKKDPEIVASIEKRRKNIATLFRDEEVLSKMPLLPPQLRPNPNGITDAQFQVYADFARLSRSSRIDSTSPIGPPQGVTLGQDQSANAAAKSDDPNSTWGRNQQQPATYAFELDSILSRVTGEKVMTSVTRSLLTLKIRELNEFSAFEDQAKARLILQARSDLWKFVEKTMNNVCQAVDEDSELKISEIEFLSLVSQKYQAEDFRKKLVGVFLEMEECYLLNVDLNLLLMQNDIISVAEWDKQLAAFIHNSPGQLQESEFRFLAEFLDRSVLSSRFLQAENIPNLLRVLDLLAGGQDTFFAQTFSRLKARQPSDIESRLKNNFHKWWVELSYIDDSEAQEKEMNNFFKDLSALNFDQDKTLLYKFCDVMVRTSIDLTLFTRDGQMRTNNNTLDYRLVDSFIKLVVVLLGSFDLNKQEFMSRIFEFIRRKLEEDHQSLQKTFNQKPYYRMLINILTAVNMSDCFNQKTQKEILFDLANLLRDLNPNKFPAFAFAWLELLSHKLFLPHFLKKSTGSSNENSADLNKSSFESEDEIKNEEKSIQRESNAQNQRWYKLKELLVQSFTFLKYNLVPGKPVPQALQHYYTATLRVVLILLKDYQDFLCEFHFNFVNSLPAHAIQLRNMILAAYPKNNIPPYPFSKDLKVDTLDNVKEPRILSNFEVYLSVNNIKEDLDNYFKTKKPQLLTDICNKMMAAKENINGRMVPSSSIINAVVLYIAIQTCHETQQDAAKKQKLEMFKSLTMKLNDETRLVFLNSIVNELRYPNSHTFYFCLILLFLFVECKQTVQEQISQIMFERLQAHRPYPWGLMINFRELIQNTKYGFMKSPFVMQNKDAITCLFQTNLRLFVQFLQNTSQPAEVQGTRIGAGYNTQMMHQQ